MAAFNGLEETLDLLEADWDLYTNGHIVFCLGAIDISIGSRVDEAGDFLGEDMALVAKSLVLPVDVIWVVAEVTLAGVKLEPLDNVVLIIVYWTRE